MANSEEKVLDAENWKNEASAIINDIRDHVKDAAISNGLKSSDSHIFINITILEDVKYCVEVSNLGFRIVGKNYDINDISDCKYFETPYSLLNSESHLFRESFGNTLIRKLENLNK